MVIRYFDRCAHFLRHNRGISDRELQWKATPESWIDECGSTNFGKWAPAEWI